jgi:hypothetical protein
MRIFKIIYYNYLPKTIKAVQKYKSVIKFNTDELSKVRYAMIINIIPHKSHYNFVFFLYLISSILVYRKINIRAENI